MTNYIYNLYGKEEIFLSEALYSIRTLVKWVPPESSRVIVFSDRPAPVDSLPVIWESIADQIDAMKGQFGYGFRIKLCTILKCAESFPGNIVYLDSDTIVRGPIHEVAVGLGSGCALMYQRERLAGRFPLFDGFHTQLPGGVKYAFGPQSCMFNAGVIGIARDDAAIANTALALCDALLLDGRKNHVSEQLAVSEAFRISGRKLLEAHKVVIHYYRNSAKAYMRHKLSRVAAEQTKEPFSVETSIPYSYPRVQLFKLLRRVLK